MVPSMFSPRDLYPSSDSDDEHDALLDANGGDDKFVEQIHTFAGMPISVREFEFHPVNANLAWPGAAAFAAWLLPRAQHLRGRRILELGSGTGALAIFLRRAVGCDITTCDYNDDEIRDNIAHNCRANGLEPLPHVPHTWGDEFPVTRPSWDLLLASDILLYVKQYPNLIKTLHFLLSCYEPHGPGPTAPVTRNIVSRKAPEGTGNIDHLANGQSTERVEFTSQDSSGAGVAVASAAETEEADPSSGWSDQTAAEGEREEGASIACKVHEHGQGGARHGHWPRPSLLMSWRRRIPRPDELLFFNGCRSAGLVVDDLGSRVYSIYLMQAGQTGAG